VKQAKLFCFLLPASCFLLSAFCFRSVRRDASKQASITMNKENITLIEPSCPLLALSCTYTLPACRLQTADSTAHYLPTYLPNLVIVCPQKLDIQTIVYRLCRLCRLSQPASGGQRLPRKIGTGLEARPGVGLFSPACPGALRTVQEWRHIPSLR